MHYRQIVGNAGERLVVDLLRSQGYRIIACNVSLHQQGEVDIVAQKEGVVACIEVKTRYNTAVPFTQLIPRSKQRKIIRVAKYIRQRYRLYDAVIRFDVAFVDMTVQPAAIEYIENAFQA